MNIHVLRHVAFEDEAYIATWAIERGHILSGVDLYAGAPLPAPRDCDLLVAMGGSMNIYDYDQYPWLAAEKECIRRTVAAGKAVLGICLGGQLIADALSGPVGRNPVKEIGWFPTELTALARTHQLFAGFPPTFEAFHWHGDTFALPPASMHAATSRACPNQAFIYGDKVVALQFHLESTAASVERLIEHCGHELVNGAYIQSAAAIRRGLVHCETTNALMARLLDNLARAFGE